MSSACSAVGHSQGQSTVVEAAPGCAEDLSFPIRSGEAAATAVALKRLLLGGGSGQERQPVGDSFGLWAGADEADA